MSTAFIYCQKLPRKTQYSICIVVYVGVKFVFSPQVQEGLLDKAKEPFSIRAKEFFPVEKTAWVCRVLFNLNSKPFL